VVIIVKFAMRNGVGDWSEAGPEKGEDGAVDVKASDGC